MSAPVEPQTLKLSAQVADLERRVTALDNLCGEMIACLRVNLLRGTLTTDDNDQFRDLLDAWSRRMMV